MAQAFRANIRHPRLWLAMGFVWTALIIVGCFAPSAPSADVIGFDKLLHTGAFAGLAFWFGAVYSNKRHWLVAALLLALGSAIEIGQTYTAYRSGDLFDLAADLLGIVIGITLAKTRLAHAFGYIETRATSARN